MVARWPDDTPIKRFNPLPRDVIIIGFIIFMAISLGFIGLGLK